jgi:hypothetical protein
MNPELLLAQIALGEDSSRQFKVDIKNADALASEMAACATNLLVEMLFFFNGLGVILGVNQRFFPYHTKAKYKPNNKLSASCYDEHIRFTNNQ